MHPLDVAQLADIRRQIAERPHSAPAGNAFLLRLLDEAQELAWVVDTPWRHPDLQGWAIVGMNHYLHIDEMYLFVAMTSGNYCIKAEGPDDGTIWTALREKARAIDVRLADKHLTKE